MAMESMDIDFLEGFYYVSKDWMVLWILHQCSSQQPGGMSNDRSLRASGGSREVIAIIDHDPQVPSEALSAWYMFYRDIGYYYY